MANQFIKNIIKTLAKETGKPEAELAKLGEGVLTDMYDNQVMGGILKREGRVAADAEQAITAETPPSPEKTLGQMKYARNTPPSEFGADSAQEAFTPANADSVFGRAKTNMSKEPELKLAEPAKKMSPLAKTGLALGAAGAGAAGYNLLADEDAKKQMQAMGQESPAETSVEPLTAKDITVKSKEAALAKAALQTGSKLKPVDIDSLYREYKQSVEELPKTDRTIFLKEIADLHAKKEAAIKLWNEDKKTTKWAEVASQFGQAFAQLGAAIHGMKTGVDMSNIPFSKTDWKSHYDSLKESLDADLSLLSDTEKTLKEEREGTIKGQDKERETLREELFKKLGLKVKEAENVRDIDEKRRSEGARQGFEAGQQNQRIESNEKIAGIRGQANAGKETPESKAARIMASKQGEAGQLAKANALIAEGELNPKDDKAAIQAIQNYAQAGGDIAALKQQLTGEEHSIGPISWGGKVDKGKIPQAIAELLSQGTVTKAVSRNTDSEMVRMTQADGKQVNIPKSKVPEALKRGAKLAQ